MNRTVHKLCAWSGTAVLVSMAIGFILLARFIPTPSPSESAQQTADFMIGHRAMIRWGLILCMFSAGLLIPFAAAISTQMRRIEGRYPILAMIQFGAGAIFALEFIYLIFFWQTATFRPDRAPELIQLLNDMAWIPFVGLTSTAALQVACFGIAILLDRRPTPLFPRWLGYYNLWVALMFTPGTFNVFFHNGPLAWNGIVAWYIPLAVFATWAIINPIFLSRAVDSMSDDADPVDADELLRLRAEVDRLLARR